jgi:hypothetical protein
VLAKYGERTYRIYEIFLAWSVLITKHGSSSAYQIVCHKNRDTYDRQRFVGANVLGEQDGFRKTAELDVVGQAG